MNLSFSYNYFTIFGTRIVEVFSLSDVSGQLSSTKLKIENMKRNILLIILFIPFLGIAQLPYLGNNLDDLKKIYSDKSLTISFANDGTKIATVQTENGNYNYYFNSETGITDYCIQFMPNNKLLNYQVEWYNKNFVTISEKSWKAYLDKGKIMNIELKYDEKYDVTSFHYKAF
jgi:hypothetical protein